MMRSHCCYGNSCAMLHIWNFMLKGLAVVIVKMYMVRLVGPWNDPESAVNSRLADTRYYRQNPAPPTGESYRGLTENDSRCCGLSLLWTPIYVPRVSAITRVNCTQILSGIRKRVIIWPGPGKSSKIQWHKMKEWLQNKCNWVEEIIAKWRKIIVKE